jgi:hypothetical protein
MADNGDQEVAGPEAFPELDPLRRRVARAKLRQELRTASAPAPPEVPKLDLDLAEESMTVADKATSLGPVLVSQASQALGDDIAEYVLDGVAKDLRSRGQGSDGLTATLLVCTSREPWRREETWIVLKQGLMALRSRLESLLPAPPQTVAEAEVDLVFAGVVTALGGVATAIPAVAAVAGQAINAFSQLSAHHYTSASAEVDGDALGLDLLLAMYLKSKQYPNESYDVHVDRFGTAKDAGLVADFAALATLMQHVADLDAATEREIARQTAVVDTAKETVAALDQQLLELTKKLPDDELSGPLDQLRETRRAAGADLAEERGVLGGLAATHEAAQSAIEAAADFVREALTFADDGSCPVIEAARAAEFAEAGLPSPYYVYLKPVGAGIDTLVDLKMGRDHWSALAGISAEWALVRRDGTVLGSGVLSSLRQSRTTLGKGYGALTSDRVDFQPHSRTTPH